MEIATNGTEAVSEIVEAVPLSLREENEFIPPDVLAIEHHYGSVAPPQPQIVLAIECHRCVTITRISPALRHDDTRELPSRCANCGRRWEPSQYEALTTDYEGAVRALTEYQGIWQD